jgi:cytochrome P450 / NADPH-cytochrome P450 reductase
MRLFPPATRRTVCPIEDTTLSGGKFAVKAGTPCTPVAIVAHRDTSVWGEDVSILRRSDLVDLMQAIQAEEFRPERMLDGKFEKLPVCPLP